MNNGEITLYRLQSALGGAETQDPQVLAQTKRVVLDSLIDEELAAQAAEADKLDRTPAVMQAMEEARRKVLARAWMERLTTNVSKPSSLAVSQYYTEHPELFSKRRVYTLQQLLVASPDPALLNELKQKADANVSLLQIGRLLQERQVKFSAMDGTRSAEQIPADILAELNKAKDGQTLVLEQPKATLIIHLVSSSAQPINEIDAIPRIRRFLANQAWGETVATEVKRLRQTASIAYMGEFATPTEITAQQQGPDRRLMTVSEEKVTKGVPAP